MVNKIYYGLMVLLVQLRHPKWLKINTLVVLAQAIHETGTFTSNVFKTNKNMFGMKLAKSRKTVAVGESKTGEKSAIYKSHWDSIVDYFLRQENFKLIISDPIIYINETTNSGYATDKQYASKWFSRYDALKKENIYLYIIGICVIIVSILISICLMACKKFNFNFKFLKKWKSKTRKQSYGRLAY